MSTALSVGATPISGDSALTPVSRLPPKLVDDAARRLSMLAVFLAVVVIIVQVFQRIVQPQLAPVIDDLLNRFVTLTAVLMAAAVFAVERYRLVTARTRTGRWG